MGLLDRISPQQRKLLLYGVPGVAVLALGLRLGRGSTSSATSAGAEDATSTRPMGLLATITSGGATDVLGVGQIADFESKVTAALGSLADQIATIGKKEPDPPAGPTPIYPNFAPNPKGPGTYGQCPPGRVPVAGASGWTCATKAEYDAIAAYVGGQNR